MTNLINFLRYLKYPSIIILSSGAGVGVGYLLTTPTSTEEFDNMLKQKEQEAEELVKKHSEILKEAEIKLADIERKYDQEKKNTNQVTRHALTTYSSAVKVYTDCLDKLFEQTRERSGWFSQWYWSVEERVKQCKTRPEANLENFPVV